MVLLSSTIVNLRVLLTTHSQKHQHEPGAAYVQKTNPVIYARQHQISFFRCMFENVLNIEFQSNVRMLLVDKITLQKFHFVINNH